MKISWRFWIFVIFIWGVSTFLDRIWWIKFSGIPSWDQADYLNSALDHGRALGLLPGGKWKGVAALLDLSPKIPPLASLVNGTVMALMGDRPSEAAWSLSIWHGLLLFGIASWGMRLSGVIVASLAVVFVALAPAFLDLRSDFLLEMPLSAMTTLAISCLGWWWHPKTGGRWLQAFCAAFFSLSALLVKQSALLVLLPSVCWVVWVGLHRSQKTRYQTLAAFGFVLMGLFPWLHHNWITTIGGTNRAVFESAAREGDPSLWTFANWLWYPRILLDQLGPVILIGGLSGLCLLLLARLFSSQRLIKQSLLTDDLDEWHWLIITFAAGWLLTSISPNKGDRYITPLLPLLILLLARGFWQWWIWWVSSKPLASRRYIAPVLFAGLFIALPAPLTSYKNRIAHRHQGPVEDLVRVAGGGEPNNPPTTLIVVPSTPDLNQHNVSYYGRLSGGTLVGRQLGSSQGDVAPVLAHAKWVVLAEGDQGSVRDSAELLDQAVRKSKLFLEIRRFSRPKGGSYSLWRRRENTLSSETFAERFPSLAVGLSGGLKGLEPIFNEVEVNHMLDGHFLYRDVVREKALNRLERSHIDEEAHWTLALLSVVANRPKEAAKHFAVLEALSKDNPWPSIYRCVVTLADWNPWEAAAVANRAKKIYSNDLLIGMSDLSSLLAGSVWRFPAAQKSIPASIRMVEQSLSSPEK